MYNAKNGNGKDVLLNFLFSLLFWLSPHTSPLRSSPGPRLLPPLGALLVLDSVVLPYTPSEGPRAHSLTAAEPHSPRSRDRQSTGLASPCIL